MLRIGEIKYDLILVVLHFVPIIELNFGSTVVVVVTILQMNMP